MKYLWLTLTLYLVSIKNYSQKVDSIAVYSASMQKTIETIVITPASYSTRSTALPVLYLLHGHSGNHTDWIKKVPYIKYFANASQCIVVSPNAANSWYFDSPAIPGNKYETFMSSELVKFIDANYNTQPVPNKRAITGLSMGGHGALMLAIKYPAVYGAAGSMSGGLDLRPFMKQFDLSKVIADTSHGSFTWKNYSVLEMADSTNMKNLRLIIDCGVNDFFMSANRALHQKLLQHKVAHEYIERPGTHNWRYWANAVEYQFLFFRKYFHEKN